MEWMYSSLLMIVDVGVMIVTVFSVEWIDIVVFLHLIVSSSGRYDYPLISFFYVRFVQVVCIVHGKVECLVLECYSIGRMKVRKKHEIGADEKKTGLQVGNRGAVLCDGIYHIGLLQFQ
jgi:hypothetical protein